MSALSVVAADERPFYTPVTLATKLAVSERTVRQLLATGEIPSYKVAGLRRIDPTDVDRYLARHRSGRR